MDSQEMISIGRSEAFHEVPLLWREELFQRGVDRWYFPVGQMSDSLCNAVASLQYVQRGYPSISDDNAWNGGSYIARRMLPPKRKLDMIRTSRIPMP